MAHHHVSHHVLVSTVLPLLSPAGQLMVTPLPVREDVLHTRGVWLKAEWIFLTGPLTGLVRQSPYKLHVL